MHQNPFWVTRIEIPDETGELVNILEEPRWMDAIWLPRNGGRVVFRSRFPDYVGTYVNHCHVLQHEDNGMMQVVEVTPFADQANYVVGDKDSLFPSAPRKSPDESVPAPAAREDMWKTNVQFVDRNHHTGQVFPFNDELNAEVRPPSLEP